VWVLPLFWETHTKSAGKIILLCFITSIFFDSRQEDKKNI
jgi:hypothetical protein